MADAAPMAADAALLVGQGFLVGVAVTAPPGPVGALCIQRTLLGGLWQGLSTALGALLADAFYGTVAAFGLAQVTAPTGWVRQAAAAVVAVLLSLLGFKYLRRAWRGEGPLQEPPEKSRGAGLAALTATTFVLTLATPGTLPAFVVMFTSLGLADRCVACPGGPFLVVLGVVVGAAAWWLLLCGVIHRFRAHTKGWMRGMEYACGLLLFVGAVGAVWSGFVR